MKGNLKVNKLDGTIAGFDLVSKPQAYMHLHKKILRSYCMEAVRLNAINKESKNNNENKNKNRNINDENINSEKTKDSYEKPIASVDRAINFMEEIKQCNETHFKSIGLGEDYRYESQYIIDSALVYEQIPIHMSFFKLDDKVMRENKKKNSTIIFDDLGIIQDSKMSSYTDRKRKRSQSI